MRGITSGLQPRRYAEGDLVEEDKGFFGGVMDFFKEYGPMASLPMAAYEYATDPEKAKERYTKEGLSKRNEQFKDYIFDYTDPIEYATLPLYLAGPAGAAANKGIKAARVANKIKKAGPAEKILDNKATKGILNIGGPVAGISADIAIDPEIDFGDVVDAGKYYGTKALDSVKNIFTNDAVDDAQEDVDEANKKETETDDEKNKDDESLTKEQRMMKGIAALFEAYGDSQSGGAASLPGGMIRGTAIDTPEITRYQNGGIADMMPQEPMMMADGGIAHFALGGAAIKKAIAAGVKKGISALNKPIKAIKKEAKAIKEARKTPKASTKKSDSTDLVLYDDAAAAARTTRAPSAMDAFPPLLGGTAVATGKALKATGKMLNRNKRAIGAAALGYGAPAAGAYGIYKAVTGKDDNDGNDKGKDLTSESAAKVKLPDSLRDFHLENSMARAQAAGRDTPNFVDYAASFPKSYTDKLGSDPEFAKQMMAGFMAMMKPTEGFVPRNAFVDFGEAAMAEGARQEGQIPEALKTLQALEENPTLKAAYLESKRGEISPEDSLAAGAGLMSQVKEIAGSIAGREIKPKENLVKEDGSVVTTTELIILYNTGGLPAVQQYAQTLVPEEG